MASSLDGFQCSKSSILKKDGLGSKTKKVRFNTAEIQPANGKRRPADVDAIVCESYSTKKRQKERQLIDGVSKPAQGQGRVQEVAMPSPEEFEVEAILDHKQVSSLSHPSPANSWDSEIIV